MRCLNFRPVMNTLSYLQALFVSSKLKIFDLLKEKGAMASLDIAKQVKASVCGTERLLDACAALGLLEKSHQGNCSL